MGINSIGYKFFFVLHILSVVIGFGAVFFNGRYVRMTKGASSVESKAILDASGFISYSRAIYFIYLVPVFGILLIVFSNSKWSFQQTWISATFVLWFLIIGLFHGAIRPNEKKLRNFFEQKNPSDGKDNLELKSLYNKESLYVGLFHTMLVLAIVLMIFKPGA